MTHTEHAYVANVNPCAFVLMLVLISQVGTRLKSLFTQKIQTVDFNKSRKSRIVVYSRWNLEFEFSQAMKDSKPALFCKLLNLIFNLSKCTTN